MSPAPIGLPRADSSRLLTLDALRGLAAGAVIFWHLDFIGPFARSGYLAVDFFFLMSGVVIARAYGERLRSGLGVAGFMRERLVRLYPLYLLGFAIGLTRLIGQIAADHPGRLSWTELGLGAAFNLLMLPSPATDIMAPVNIPAWSLFFELLVNLAWAKLLLQASSRSLAVLVAVLGAGLCAAVAAAGSAKGGWLWSELHVGLLRSFFGFTLGVLLARAFAHWRSRASALAVLAAAALCALLLVDVAPPYRVAYDLAAIVLCFPLIVCLGVAFQPPAALQRIARALGDISYPVYVLHFAPTFSLSYLARKFDVSPALWIPLFVAGLCALSLYLARHYDPAARRSLQQWLAARRLAVNSAVR